MTNSQKIQIPAENLIPVFTAEIGGISTLAVNARELHEFLESSQRFSDWIKNRINDFEFVKNQDFLVSEIYDTKPGRGGNKKPVIEYILTLDMAKELSMVEKNEKGRMVRKYFIECERKIHEVHETTPSQEINDRLVFIKAVRKRVLFWMLEKRDRIVHPGIDRHALFSITMDIRVALTNELIDDTVRIFPTSSDGDPEMIRFINEWVPSFFREMANVT